LSRNGVPSSTLGIDGDFYIDIKSMNMYGPKVKNKWPLPISLQGPAGPIGPSGVDGKNGSSGSSSSSVGATGPAGPAGPSNVQSVSISNWTLSTNTPAGISESTGFGTLEAGKKYYFTIIVKGVGAIGLTRFRAGLELKCSDVSSTPDYEYSYAFAAAHTSGTSNTLL